MSNFFLNYNKTFARQVVNKVLAGISQLCPDWCQIKQGLVRCRWHEGGEDELAEDWHREEDEEEEEETRVWVGPFQ